MPTRKVTTSREIQTRGKSNNNNIIANMSNNNNTSELY